MTDQTNSVSGSSSKERVLIFDTTLRDGEQCPGATMTFEEKLEVADLLDRPGGGRAVLRLVPRSRLSSS